MPTPVRKRKMGVWAGSSPTQLVLLRKGLKKLKAMGVEPIVTAATLKWAAKKESSARPFLAGPDKAKVQSFYSIWKRRDFTDVFCVRGGYGALRLLRHLDKLPLEKHPPKRLWGFSDLTVLQHYLYFRLGLSWVHSPMITGPSFLKPNPTETQIWSQLAIGSLMPAFKIKQIVRAKTIVPESAVLLGGNLASLATLLGTPWLKIPEAPFFLFVEDLNEPDYKIDRLLTQFSACGFLKNCRGIVMGDFTDCPKHLEIFTLWAREHGLNLFARLPVGHTQPKIPIPMGQIVEMSKNVGSSYTLKLPKLKLG